MKWIVAISFLIGSFVGFSQPAGYGYGKQITIPASQVSGTTDFTNFPVLIEVTHNDFRTNGNGGKMENSNGYDVVFTTTDCNTILDHQIEEYTASNGEIIFWVKVPTLYATTNTLIHMYYGNSSVNTDPSTDNVWDANFTGVYHLSNNDLTDAAGSNNCSNGSTGNRGNAKIDGGRTYNNANDYIECPVTGMSMTTGTVTLWARADAFPSAHQYFYGHTATSSSWASRIQLYTNENTGLLDLGLGNTHSRNTDFYDLNSGQWYFLGLTWDNGDYEVYVDDQLEASGTYSGLTTLNTSNEHDLGNDGRGSARDEGFDGRLDEFQFSNVARSGNWIITAHNIQDNPGALVFTTEYTAANLCATLPIELVRFDAERSDKDVFIQWETVTELNTDLFIIERSLDGDNWASIGSLKAAGNSNTTRLYDLVDIQAPTSQIYYRLIELDKDGTRTSHSIKLVEAIEGENGNVKEFFVNYTDVGIEIFRKKGFDEVRIIDMDGKTVARYVPELNSIEFSIDGYAPGIYAVQALFDDKISVKKFLVK